MDGGLTCVECSSSRVWADQVGGEVVCTTCGAVLPEYGAEVMDCSSCEVGYDADGLEGIRTRLRGTMVGWGVYGPGMSDGVGRRFTVEQFTRGDRLEWLDRRSLAGASLLSLVKIVEGMIARLHLPKAVGVRAVEIYRKAHAVGIRMPLRRIGTAAIFIACRENGIPVSMKQIVHPCDMRLVWKMHNRIMFALELRAPLHDATRHVSRIVAAANLPPRVERDAMVLLRRLSEMDHEKKGLATPLAAAAIHLCSRQLGIEISKRQIASAARANEGTVGEYCRLIATTSSLA